MSLATEIANAAAEAIGPIAENTVARIVDGVTKALREEVVQKLSGKTIKLEIQIPDLTK